MSKEIDFILNGEFETTKSGLKYQVIKEGEGKKPKAKNTVTCHYAGYLTDGTQFDSSYERGKPASFPLSAVIEGWTEGLQLMSPGAEYWFLVPSELGYGSRGAGQVIPAHARLLFKVELISF